MAEPFRHRLRVRWSECDLQGVVFYPHYLAYLDHTVTELWREAVGPYTEMIPEHGVDMVVAEARMRYRDSARFDDELETLRPSRAWGHVDHHRVPDRAGCRRRAAHRGRAAPRVRGPGRLRQARMPDRCAPASSASRPPDGPPADRRAREDLADQVLDAALRLARRSSTSCTSRGVGAQARGRRDPLRRRARGRQRDHRRPQGARTSRASARSRVEVIDSSISDAATAAEKAAPRPALRRGRLGGGRGADLRGRPSCPSTFLAFMVARRPDRGGRDLPRLADPDRRRDGRRARSSARSPALCVALVQRRREPGAAVADRARGRASRSGSPPPSLVDAVC